MPRRASVRPRRPQTCAYRWKRRFRNAATQRSRSRPSRRTLEIKRDVFRKLGAALSPGALRGDQHVVAFGRRSGRRRAEPRARRRHAFFQSRLADEARRDRARRTDLRRSGRSGVQLRRAHRQDAGRRGRYARVHRQPRRASVLPAVHARARARRRLRRGTRRAGPSRRFSHGAVRADGSRSVSTSTWRQPSRSTSARTRPGWRRWRYSARWWAQDAWGERAARDSTSIARDRRSASIRRSRRPATSATPQEQVAIVGFGGIADEIAELRRADTTRTAGASRTTTLARRDIAGRDDRLRRRRRIERSQHASSPNSIRSWARRRSSSSMRTRPTSTRALPRCAIPSASSATAFSARWRASAPWRSSIRKASPTTRSSWPKSSSTCSARASCSSRTCRGSSSGARSDPIVNEAAIAVHEDVASPDDVDTAMRLGTNYPIGPIAWGREIGGARLMRILKRLARHEGEAFAPHRSLWVLRSGRSGRAGRRSRQ